MNKNRLEAFSDGVFAIIITIMVLEIKIPHSSNWADLQALIPVFISYFMSFLFIAIYWGNHHHLLHSIRRVSTNMIWANMNLLFWLSLVPFVTGWMGENHFAENTVATYGIILFISGFAYSILQKEIEKNSHNLSALQKAFVKQKQKGLISTFSYGLSIPLAYMSPIISGLIFLFVAIIWLVPDKNIEKALQEED